MTQRQQIFTWLGILGAVLALLLLLSDVLLPFVAAMAVAYLLDPVADRLQRAGLGRTTATLTITVAFFAGLALLFVLLVPAVQTQVANFLQRLPGYIDILRNTLLPWLQGIVQDLGIAQQFDLKAAIADHAREAMTVFGNVITGLLGGGKAVLNIVALLAVTPIVSFYLLRDWDRLVERIDSHLPREHAATIRAQAVEIDRVLAGFVRGQLLVCLALATFYGAGLTLIGLDFGLFIGITAGAISFIPYIGSGVGLVLSLGVALAQFWPDWPMIAAVAAIFAAGQFIEGNFLTPKLVGDRVGLHPVWIMFGLFAGGALFGFVGILLAVPIFAVIGVLTRFALEQYRASRLYWGGTPPNPDP